MTLDDIKAALGEDAVEDVEFAVRSAIEAGSHLDNETTSRAVRELLLSMLAAVIITPPDGADQRATHDAGRLKVIVNAALKGAAS